MIDIKSLAKNNILLRPININDTYDMNLIWTCEMGLKLFSSNSPQINYELAFEKVQKIVNSYSSNDIYIWAIEYDKKVIGLIEVINLNNDNFSYEINYNISNRIDNRNILIDAMNLIHYYFNKKFGLKNRTNMELEV